MIIPSLVYSSTDRCDMRCDYCPTEGQGSYGENFEISVHPLSPEEVVWTANTIGELGFETFRLTGGEPLLNINRVAQILRGVVAGGQFKNIRLNTNGSQLLRAIDSLRGIPFTALKVSLDTLDEPLFRQITKSRNHALVLAGIEAAKSAGLPVEVNTVLTSETAKGIVELIEWCQQRGVPLKILDLVGYDSQPEGYIAAQKASVNEVDKYLTTRFGLPTFVQLSGERGIYMKRYGTNPYVLFKDCSEGTIYTNYCQGCPHFPCEEGIHHLSLSTDGHLRPCRIRNNIFWELRPIIDSRDAVRLTSLVRSFLEKFYTGALSFVPLNQAPK
jgi:GTP 3',8-cyclase